MTNYPTNWKGVEQRSCGPDCALPQLRLERRMLDKDHFETRHVISKRILLNIADRRTFYVETGKVKSQWLAEGKKPTGKKLFYGRGTSERQALQNLLYDMGIKTGTCA